MTSLISLSSINQGITEIKKLKTLCDEVLTVWEEFKKYIEDKKFDLGSSGSFEDQIKNHVNVLDTFDELVEKRTAVSNKGNDLKKQLDEMIKKVNNIVSFDGKKEDVDKLCNDLVDKINKLNEYKLIREKSDMKKYSRKTYKLSDVVEDKEIKQLEEWTKKKCREMIFYSDRDRWCQHSTDFDDKILGRSNLIFIVEDEQNNKFGYFTPKKIEKVSTYYNDTNAFLFSLKSNGRLNGMMKFESLKTDYGFYLYSKSDPTLFSLYSGFYIHKENNKTNSSCYENASGKYYDLHDYHYPLIGKPNRSKFTPKRFIVIQMN